MNPLQLPKLDQYVNDFSGVLSDTEQRTLNELYASHERNTTEQVVVVLIPNREGNELIDIALKVFNENQIGQRGKNNGLLLIIATEEKKIRLMTGKGMEIAYSEMRCRNIIEGSLRPLLEEEKYRELIEKFSSIVSSPPTPGEDSFPTKKELHQSKTIAIISGVFVLFGSLFIDSLISGGIAILLSLLLLIIMERGRRTKNTVISIFTYIWVILLFFLGVFGIVQPADCRLISDTPRGGKEYECVRVIFGSDFSYSKTIGGETYHSTSNGSSSSNWDSGGSSFGGGGGSSNGGGYGD